MNSGIPSEKRGLLWLYIGHTHKTRNQFIQVEQAYQHAAERDANWGNLAVIYEVQVIIRQREWERERAEKIIQQTL